MRFAHRYMLYFATAILVMGAGFGCASMEKSAAMDRAAQGTVNALPEAVEPAALAPGLSAVYVFGYWRHLNYMPGNERILQYGTPGPAVPFLDHSARMWGDVFDSGRSRGVGMLLQGYIRFPASGTWELQAVSNDGLHVFLADSLVISDPDVHGDRLSETATVSIPKPGFYPLTLRYFQHKGGYALRLLWKPPGADGFSTIPADAYFHPAK